MACCAATGARAATPTGWPLETANPGGRLTAISCMTSAILHEAGREPSDGQEAVAEVILNRLNHSAYPKTICGVIFQGSQRRTGCQFSFTCDGSLRRSLPATLIARAREVATRAVDGQLAARTSGATHYHADYVSPYWAPSLLRVAAIGRHIFYRNFGASAKSSLARYTRVGDTMPAILSRNLPVATLGVSSAPATPPPKGEPFMPWGLTPAVVQAATSSKR